MKDRDGLNDKYDFIEIYGHIKFMDEVFSSYLKDFPEEKESILNLLDWMIKHEEELEAE